MSTGLEQIALKARSEKKLRFTSLAHHVSSDLIHKHLRKISSSSAAGVDGMKRDDVLADFDMSAKDVVPAIQRQGYRPPPVRRVYIPKPGKTEKRPIGVPTVLDRSVQGAVAEVLSQIYEQDFLPCSFGGRPQLSAHNALFTINKAVLGTKVSWLVEADLKNFFGSLDHAWMIRFLEHRVGDPRIITIIRRWLKAGVFEDNATLATDTGTPQGGSISVLLSNIYLHYALDLWFEKVVKPQLRGESRLVRYLDDFVVLFQYEDDARRFYSGLPSRLGKFGLTLEPSKTRLLRFGRFSRANHKTSGTRQQVASFLGFTLVPTKGRDSKFALILQTQKERLRRFIQNCKILMRKILHLPISDQATQLSARLRGHFNYFGVSGNTSAIKGVHYQVILHWRKCLSRRSQKGKVNWEKMKRILERYPLPKADIRISYSKFDTFAIM